MKEREYRVAFTTDEKTIIKMYSGFALNRDKLLASMHKSLPLVEELEIAELMDSIIRRVNAMTDADFMNIDLSDALDEVSPEN
jgi:hypothetical protein